MTRREWYRDSADGHTVRQRALDKAVMAVVLAAFGGLMLGLAIRGLFCW